MFLFWHFFKTNNIIQAGFHQYSLIWASKEIHLTFAFQPLYRDFYRLLIATYIDHWVWDWDVICLFGVFPLCPRRLNFENVRCGTY